MLFNKAHEVVGQTIESMEKWHHEWHKAYIKDHNGSKKTTGQVESTVRQTSKQDSNVGGRSKNKQRKVGRLGRSHERIT